MNRVLHTIHGERGAIRIEDDGIEIVTKNVRSDGSVAWETESACMPSASTASGNTKWFSSVLTELEVAIARRQILGSRIEAALGCAEIIDACCRSVRSGGQEVALRD